MTVKVLALVGLAMAAAAPASANETFKDWWVACDNTRECAAFGFAGEAFEMSGYLKVARGAHAAEAAQAKLVMEGPPGPWALSVDGKALATVTAASEDGDGGAAAALTPVQSAAVLAAAANGKALQVAAAGKPIGAISLAGSSAALRWMDDQQKRAGGVTALVAKGPAPASAVPAPPAPPLVQAAPAVSQAGLPAKPPKSVMALMGDCDDDIATLEIAPIAARLSPDLTLWAPLCTRGAYNMIYSFAVVDAKGAARRLPIRYASSAETTTELMNVDYDPATRTLSNFEKGRGLGDCGAVNTWVWDGKAFAPTAQDLMGECRGVSPDDWVTTWRTRAK
ncbi:hypothetical protein GGQ61_004391 [Phenylobacterium haematophilum]|uniref:DUF1176 domain-containing protein n=1 Tax=Phenylobacterium haematophilum TaxID=98513 RepID=A0A840A8J7_9CAUL|nr:DUF1176 domain-containing protein [Phenylobacterium haematophilum]MBB3893642.1 hypothetical protein [Phenylobacterium haematophilum]